MALAALPQAGLLLQGRRPFARTPVAGLLALFLLSAGVGAWAAFDHDLALARFRLLIVGLLLFDAAAGLRPQDQGWFMAGLAGMSGAVAASFLFGWPQTGVPQVDPRFAISPNSVGGMLAVTVPFAAALLLSAIGRRSFWWVIYAMVALGLGVAGLWLTGSRGGLGALAAAGAFASCVPLSRWALTTYGPRRIAGALALGIGLIVLAGLLLAPAGTEALRHWVTGDETAGSRLDLYQNSLYLASEVLVLGAGLGSFPGMYSSYILLIPYFFLGHAHNLYLDLLIEQGALGLASATALLVGSTAVLLWGIRGTSKDRWVEQLLAGATATALLAALLHGMIDDPLYASAGLPMLLLLPGLAWSPAALAGAPDGTTRALRPSVGSRRPKRWTFIGVAILVVVAIVLSAGLRAAATANLGVVRMARVELAGWPEAEPDRDFDPALLDAAGQTFERALSLDPHNATAHFHLGLMASERQDFPLAMEHLQAAFDVRPGHRGIVKALGYSLAWTGDLDSAASLLAPLPEVTTELEVYQWWWGTQGREDLAQLATELSLIVAQKRVRLSSP